MNCQLTLDNTDGDRYVYRCSACGRRVRHKSPDPTAIRATCGVAGPPELIDTLKPRERAAFEQAAKSEGMLLGDYIAAMTTAIGIPPCGGCEKRKAWLNAAHAWILGRATGAAGHPAQ